MIQAATNSQGVFPVAVRSHSSSFRISISGGTTNGNPFPWHLMADVELTDPAHQIAVVNPVTTIVSLVLDARPDLKLDGAEALVRSFLTIPVNYPLGLALRQGTHYKCPFFSAVTFLTEALAAGGLDAFEHLLLQELTSDSTHSFRPPTLLGDTGSTATSTVEAGLYAGVLDYAGAESLGGLTGWTISLTGLPTGSSDEISALLDALAALQSEIENLTYQVAQLTQVVQSTATQTQYNQIVVPAQGLAAQVNGVENDLAYFANACPPLSDGSTPTTPDAFCTNEKVSVNTELNDVNIQQSYVTMESYVEDNPTIAFEGMLHLYSLYLGESKAFFRAADSTKMQDLYNYWDAALTQAANLKVELLHENGAQDNPGGEQQLTDFLGNPDLNPPTTGTFQANQAANLKLILSPVPAGTVVSTVDHTMWSLLPWYKPTYPLFPVPKYYPTANCGAEYIYSPILTTGEMQQGYAGFYNWADAPDYNQLQAAVKLAPSLSSGTDWQDWLVAQTNTSSDESPASSGFFNMLACDARYGNAAWSYTVASTSPYSLYVMLVNNDTFTAYPTDNKHWGFAFPTRPLASGEQYFWTN